jgi:tRNA splicing endonuclease|tara:strand:- start:31 stop:486 length:456 start_codon:yes stop_codon:yes gene_type:complete
MRNNLGFRGWFYFRQGWSVYFAFIFAAVNTLTVTYFLAIDNYPFLKDVFPSFIHYIAVIVLIGIPLLVLVGYAHYKRTASFKAEADIHIEANPHLRRILTNSEFMLSMSLQLSELSMKLMNNEKLTSDEMNNLKQLQIEFQKQIDDRRIRD